jgi:hypothetical protein
MGRFSQRNHGASGRKATIEFARRGRNPGVARNAPKDYGATFGANKLRKAAAIAGNGGRIGGKIW